MRSRGVFFASACKFAYMIMQIRDPPPSLTMRVSVCCSFACAFTGICRSFVITPSLAISYSDLPKMFYSQIRLVSPSKPRRRKLMICSEAFSPPSAGLTSVSMFAMIIWMDGADALSRTP